VDQVFFNIDWETIVPAIVGGLIAGACTITAIIVQHRNDMEREILHDAILIEGFVQAALAEIATLWESYQGLAGKRLELLERGKPFLYIYPMTGDYFSVYTANAFFIGRIKDERLRKAIVETYTRARWLIDSYKINNDMVQRLNQLDLMRQESDSKELTHMMWEQEQALIKYMPKLVEMHKLTKTSVEHLFMIAKKEMPAK
jgi:hypothetical protein